jgi:hypothetical protein
MEWLMSAIVMVDQCYVSPSCCETRENLTAVCGDLVLQRIDRQLDGQNSVNKGDSRTYHASFHNEEATA